MPKTKRTTIRDVAKASGVSVFTVSMVLNKKGRISDETRQHVRRVARKLNYDPLKNMPLARNVTAKALALAVPSLYAETNPFFWPAIATARRAASEAGYDFKLFSETALTERLSDRNETPLAMGFDCLVIFCCDPPKPCIQKILDARIPVATIRRALDIPGLIHVLDNDAQGTRLALEHLHQEHGHERIGIMTPIKQSAVPNMRVESHAEYLKSHRLPHDEALSIPYNEILAPPMDRIKDLVRSGRMTGLICMDDMQAVIIAKNLLRGGLRIPQDLAIISFNNTSGAEMFHPGLTSIEIPVPDMIRAAWQAVRDYSFDSNHANITYRFEQRLVTRESCGCPAKDDPA